MSIIVNPCPPILIDIQQGMLTIWALLLQKLKQNVENVPSQLMVLFSGIAFPTQFEMPRTRILFVLSILSSDVKDKLVFLYFFHEYLHTFLNIIICYKSKQIVDNNQSILLSI